MRRALSSHGRGRWFKSSRAHHNYPVFTGFSMTLHRSYPNKSTKQRRALDLAFKNPEARLMGGAWNTLAEVGPVGLMVRGQDPTGQLLSAY